LIPKLSYNYDEPFADSSAIPTMLVSKLASSKVKVCVSADGGDEVFGGYPRYYNKLGDFDKVKAIPDFLKKTLSGVLDVSSNFVQSKNPHHQVRIEKLKNVLSCKDLSQIYRYRSEPIHFSNKEISKLFKEKNINLSRKTFYDDIHFRNGIDPAMFMMALEYKTTLVDDILVKVDRATMAYSLEGREPLLDHRLVEFTARLNRSVHYKNNNTKSLLKEVCYQYLPSKLMDRPKKGFAIPTNRWLHNELKERVIEYSRKSYTGNQNIFDSKRCLEMISNYYKGYDKNGERIWFFLMFQEWYNAWIH